MNDFFTEAYYGKTSTIKEIEKVIGALTELSKKDPLADYTNHPLNKKLESLFVKQFGFHKIDIVWKRSSESGPIICTWVSLDTALKGKSMYALDTTGYYDKSHTHDVYMMLSSTFAGHYNVSAEEYTAVILHEIGHNFSTGFYNRINYLTSVLNIVMRPVFGTNAEGETVQTGNTIDVSQTLKFTALNVLTTTKLGKGFFALCNRIYDKLLDQVPVLKEIASVITKVANKVNVVWTRLNFINISLKLPMVILMSPLTHLQQVVSRKEEAFADSFATAYGYGVPLNTALVKLSRAGYDKTVSLFNYDKSGFAKIITDIMMAELTMFDVFASGGASHGSTGTRIATAIELINREIDNEQLPTSVKKDLKLQLGSLEKVYNGYVTAEYNGDHLKITAFVRKTIETVFGRRTDVIAKLFPDFYAGYTEISYKDRKPLFRKESVETFEESELFSYLDYMVKEAYDNKMIDDYDMSVLMEIANN